MNAATADVLVIGGGPGGYAAALRAAHHGLRTTLVDAAEVGGTCLNVGCIPSKAVIHAADRYAAIGDHTDLAALGISTGAASIDLPSTMRWKDGVVGRLRGGVTSLLAAAGVTYIAGRATIVDGKTALVDAATGTVAISARHLVIATGSQPVELPALPFGGRVISSTDALAIQKVPAALAVVGAGYIGLELGTAFCKLGSRVTVVEAASRILPQYDQALTRPVAARLEHLGIEVRLNCVARGLADDGSLILSGPLGNELLPADKVLVAVGRRPVTDGFGLEGLDLDRDGAFVAVDDCCRTSMRGVYAIGDVTGEPMLAHRATAHGLLVADVIAGLRRTFDARVMPAVCFTDPEIFSVGMSPSDAAAAGIEVAVGQFHFQANGRALTLQRSDGFVRVVARADDHALIGVQAVGVGVSELSSECSLAIEMRASLEDVALTIHAHPTLAEAIQEAASKALGRGLHST